MSTDDTPSPTPDQPEDETGLEEPAARHADHDEHLQDPDAELSETIAPDSVSMTTYQPVRFN